MYTQPQLLARGAKWQKLYVCTRLRSLGIPEKEIDDLIFKVEHQFTILGHYMGSQAEWSILHGEVSGFPEDFQFDLDVLREEALHAVVSLWED